VDVRWWGHSCFSIRDSAGRVFLLDPFDDTVGYPPARVKPDAVLITHDHFDHNAVPRVPVSVLAPGGTAVASNGGGTRAEPEPQPAPSRPSSVVPFPIVMSTGTATAAGIEVTGILADHDDQGGRRNGTTRIYIWEMGGLRWAHLGDIGQHSLRPDQREALAGVDVLFIPVGGREGR
jgi:L-ascorbate metabolism protein UlaG (beta-lactamase superfamily)